MALLASRKGRFVLGNVLLRSGESSTLAIVRAQSSVKGAGEVSEEFPLPRVRLTQNRPTRSARRNAARDGNVGKVQIPWPPNYAGIIQGRLERLRGFAADPQKILTAITWYREAGWEGCAQFIEDWCDTYDPRNAGKADKLTRIPFILFPRQREAVRFIFECMENDVNGLFEKSRDMGLTWLCVCISVYLFLFHEGSAIGWGSRKADLVDKLGVMDSIFEKIRYVLRSIPSCFLPNNFSYNTNMAYMRVYSLANGSSIAGESGDDIGRGGRTRLYFKDESAHYEHPDSIEASLSENTRCQIDISSVNGLGNPFERKRSSGQVWIPGARPLARDRTNVFVVDWRDHPEKDEDWYDTRQALFVNAGLEHVFRQEVDRDYSAAIVGTIIPAGHVRAAIDAHIKLGIKDADDGPWGASLDIADGGGDTNAFGMRKGVVLKHAEEWGARDTGVTTRRAISKCLDKGRVTMQYDAVGMGSNVKAEVNRLRDEKQIPKWVQFVPWMAGGKPLLPDARVNPHDKQSPINKDFHKNMKSQGWFMLARRFEITFRAVRQLIDPTSEPDFTYDPEDIISIDSSSIDNQTLKQLEKELSQPVWKDDSVTLKRQVDKKPDGTKSPNLADMVMMLYWPAAVPMFEIPEAVMNSVVRPHVIKKMQHMQRRKRLAAYG